MNKIKYLLVLVALLLFFSFTPFANVKTVQINGDVDTTHRLNKILCKQNFFWTSAEEMTKIIENDKLFVVNKLSKRFPLTVVVELKQKMPFVAIKSGAYYVIIDTSGVVLAFSETPDAPHVISGFTVTAAVLGEQLVAKEMVLIERAVKIVNMYKCHTDAEPKVALVDGDIIQDMDGIIVNYGIASDVELQFNNAAAIYKHLQENGATSGIINVSDPEKPYVEPIKR